MRRGLLRAPATTVAARLSRTPRTTASHAQLEYEIFAPRVQKSGAAPLLLVHGFACGKDDWGAVPKIVGTKSKRQVISFDNRGVGESSHPEGPYTIAELAQDAISVLDAAGVEKASIMGISMGGMIAQQLALDYPDRVASLILGCTTHGGKEAHPPPGRFFKMCSAWAAEAEPNDSASVDDFMRLMLPSAFLEAKSGQQLFGQFREAFLQTRRSSEGMQGQLAAMGRFNTTKRLGEITCPALVITGDLDEVMPPPNSKSLADKLPNASLTVWEGAGHFWWAHKPLEVADVLARHLDAVDEAR